MSRSVKCGLSKGIKCVLPLMPSSLQKDHQKRQCCQGEHRLWRNGLNVPSLTDVLRIHHFHLDGALITELCRLLNNDLQSTDHTADISLRYYSFRAPVPSDRLSIGHGVWDVSVDISVLLGASGLKKKKREEEALFCFYFFLIKNKVLLHCFQYYSVRHQTVNTGEEEKSQTSRETQLHADV